VIRGKRYELELCRILFANGWSVVHSARSGGIFKSYKAPDCIAVKKMADVTTVFAIEVKATKGKCVYFKIEQMQVLEHWRANGAFTFIAIRPKGERKFYLVPSSKAMCTVVSCRACISDAEAILDSGGVRGV